MVLILISKLYLKFQKDINSIPKCLSCYKKGTSDFKSFKKHKLLSKARIFLCLKKFPGWKNRIMNGKSQIFCFQAEIVANIRQHSLSEMRVHQRSVKSKAFHERRYNKDTEKNMHLNLSHLFYHTSLHSKIIKNLGYI